MGCGASSEQASENSTGAKRYKLEDEKTGKHNNEATTTPTAPDNGNATPNSLPQYLAIEKLKTTAHKVRLGLKASKAMKAKANAAFQETLVELHTIPSESPEQATIAITHSKNRTLLKPDNELILLAAGRECIRRPPPSKHAKLLSISSSFSPNFTYEQPRDLTTLDTSTFIKPKLKSYSLRYVTGYSRGISKIHISSDERLAAFALAKRKVYPTGGGNEMFCKTKQDEIDRAVHVFELQRERPLGILHQSLALTWSEEIRWAPWSIERMFSCTSDGVLTLWDVAKMRSKRVYEDTREESQMNNLLCLAVSPNGLYVVAGGDLYTEEGTLQGGLVSWKVDDGQEMTAFGEHKHPVTCCMFSAVCSERLYSGDSRGTVFHWEIETGLVLNKISGHTSVRSILTYSECLITADEQFVCRWALPDCKPEWVRQIGEEPVEVGDEADVARLMENTVPNNMKQRLVVGFPAGLLGCCIFGSSEFELLDLESGTVVLTIPTTSVITCAAAGRSVCLLGDINGNVFSLKLEMSHMLPSHIDD
eukprot:TRINITY_DN37522_c0_g1_i1.p1 TRINITY_DN37522_c0_g1~~TRINITY_DN37522_c0_g1_i1.p1  ORF type:complete len:535 (+),score=63.74 TRINITY_DN37522_c0_g1_i1:27-1631(+)